MKAASLIPDVMKVTAFIMKVTAMYFRCDKYNHINSKIISNGYYNNPF
ncbi:hypothetical protein [Serratia sp. M24T3]|nr:hypothetical protein [Serratia sp. M24T3]